MDVSEKYFDDQLKKEIAGQNLQDFDQAHKGQKLSRSEKGQRTKLVNRLEKAHTAFLETHDVINAIATLKETALATHTKLMAAQTVTKNATARYEQLKAEYDKRYPQAEESK